MEGGATAPRHPSQGLLWRTLDGLIAVRRGAQRLRLDRLGSAALLLPALILCGLLVAALATMVSQSAHSYDTFLARQGSLSFTQYDQVLSDARFREVLVRTVAMAAVTTAAALALAVPFGMAMARARRRIVRLVLLVVVFLPILTGDITRTYGWLVVLDPSGPVGWISSQLGLGKVDVLGTLWAVGLGTIQVQLPVATLVLMPAVVLIDSELEDAARTMGARPWQVFLRVVLPQLRPALVGAAAVCFALAMTEFANPALLGRGLQDYVGNLLYSTYLGSDNPSRGAAVGILMLVVVAGGVTLLVAGDRLLARRRRR